MNNEQYAKAASLLIEATSQLVPEYVLDELDLIKTNGNCAICIIDPNGMVYGKLFGSDQILARECFRIAWTKASQVHITGMKTGEFERKAFNNEIDESKYRIKRPDYIGWLGGQPVDVKQDIHFSVGFSGFRGTSDLEIVEKAIASINETS